MIKIEENIHLKDLTTLKVGGVVSFLIRIKNKEDIKEAVLFASGKKLPILLLGGGSNMLAGDKGFEGVVIKLETENISFEKEIVTVEAGVMWDKLVEETVSKNLWGLENLSAIPGTVGASVVQNIGAYGTELMEKVLEVEIFDMNDLSFKKIAKDKCEFSYRDSIFKKNEGKNYIVTEVSFKLEKTEKPNISYKDLKNYFNEHKGDISLQNIRNAVIEIRSKKFPDLNVYGTAGSFFKNVIISNDEYLRIKNLYPEVVSYDFKEEGKPDRKKISTAWLLDKVLNAKGKRVGDVGLFLNQPLVLVNFGNATSEEIKKFVEEIKSELNKKINISLEEEVVILK